MQSRTRTLRQTKPWPVGHSESLSLAFPALPSSLFLHTPPVRKGDAKSED